MKKDGRVDEDKGNHKGKVDCCLFRDENRRGEKRRRRRKRRKEEEGRGRGKGIREDMEGEVKDFFFFLLCCCCIAAEVEDGLCCHWLALGVVCLV